MKRLLITLLAALFAGGAFAQVEPVPFPDIPENHWAADAVATIADLGIVIGFPDGTFRGNEAFTRYQAALVIARLLDVINENFDARLALTEEDLASLRNALQDLASDVAAQGVRLAEVETTVAALADDVAANTARIDELASLIEAADDVDPAVLRDLQNQLASLRVAVDTAQAQAEAAEALAQEALDAALAAQARAAENAEAIAALTAVVQGFGDRITALEQGAGAAGPGIPADLLDRLARTEADIANIREFVILLRRDQVALRDRVAALEAADALQAAALADLEERVTALEENPLGFSGSITVSYRVERLSGVDQGFDVDRAYGLDALRDIGGSVFTTGAEDLDGDDEIEEGEFAQDLEDINGEDQGVEADLDLSADFGNIFNAAGAPSALNNFEAAVSIELREAHGLCEADVDFGEECPEGDEFTGYVFAVDEFAATFDPIGGDPITFVFGEEVSVEFTPYVFELDEEPGFVVNVGAPDFLAFLDPSLTVAYSAQDQVGDDEQLDFFKGAIRLTVEPIEGFFLGATYARAALNAEEFADVDADNTLRTVYGLDAAVSLSIFDFAVEYATATFDDPADLVDAEDRSLLHAAVDIDGENLPIIDELGISYRDIPGGWADFGLIESDEDFPFEEDQAGILVEASLELFILDVEAYFDTYVTGTPDADVTAFGVEVSADLFAGFVLSGFYSQISADGEVIDAAEDPFTADEVELFGGLGVERDREYETGFGVALAHAADGENALIPGLDVAFGYSQYEADFSATNITVAADYELVLSFLTLTPYVEYEIETDSDVDVTSEDMTELAVGTGLATAPLDVFLAPSLEAAVNYRTADFSGFFSAPGVEDPDAAFTATEFQWSVALVLNEFLFDNSALAVRYGSWMGENVSIATGDDDDATNISGADVAFGDQSVDGYEIVWTYFDLEMAYGVYTHDGPDADDVQETTGQVFAISYTVDF